MEFTALGAAIALFVVAVQSSPTTVSRVPLMFGSAVIGVSASVAPNADNTLAAELARREAELDAREAALEKEGLGTMNQLFAQYSLMASAALFGLLALNYILDWRRGAKLRRAAVS
jgi:hypothetical protein